MRGEIDLTVRVMECRGMWGSRIINGKFEETSEIKILSEMRERIYIFFTFD